MKKLFLLAALCVFITGCSEEPSVTIKEQEQGKPTIDIEAKTPNATNIKKETVETVGEGEPCSGPENKLCQPGLMCVKDIETAETTGVCTNTVVDANIECPKTKAPVCGLWNGKKKITYLNKCQAGRHGAEILHESFCGRINEFEKPCEAKVTSVGICDKYFTGVSFDGTTCQETPVMGCDVEAPFATIQKCEEVCG